MSSLSEGWIVIYMDDLSKIARFCSPFWPLSSLSMGACPPFSLRAIPLL